MAEVRLFYQERADGGQRSGLYVDRDSVLGMFTPGSEEPDPSLLWYVDLVWESADPPLDGRAARRWLADRAGDIAPVLEAAGRELAGGIDVDLLPWKWTCDTGHGPVEVSVSAARRFVAVDVGRRVRELAGKWHVLQPELEPVG